MSSLSKKILLVIFVITAFYAHFRLQPFINPAASLQINVNRGQAKDIARDIIGIKDKSDVRFEVNEDARIYLERELGLQRANQIAQKYGLIYNWVVTYPDGTSVYIDPDGRLNGCEFSNARLPLVADGVNGYLEKKLQIKLSDYVIKATPIQKDDHRPVKYQWERETGNTGNATEVITAIIDDGQLRKFSRQLRVPEYFKDSQDNQEQMGNALTMLAQSLFAIPYLAAAWAIIMAWRRRQLRWRVAILPAFLVTIIAIINHLNMVLLLQYSRPDNIALILSLFSIAAQSFVSTMLLVSAGDWLYRQAFPDHPSIGAWFRLGGISTPGGRLRVVIGYALFAFHLGYVSIFYGIAHRFGGWSPALVPYNDLFNSQTPWIYALLVGVHAAVFEEFLFRVVAISWLRKVIKNDVVAVVIPALMWAFAHCNYAAQPFYIRGVELTVIGVIFGFIFLRFGPLPTLISHAVFNAFLTAETFLADKSMYSSFFIVLLFIAIPALLAFLPYKKEAKIRLNKQITSADIPIPEPEIENVQYKTPHTWLIFSAVVLILMAVFSWLKYPLIVKTLLPINEIITRNYPNRPEIIRIARDTVVKQGAIIDDWMQYVAISVENKPAGKDFHDYTREVSDNIRRRLDNPAEMWVVGWIKPVTGERWVVRILPDGKVWDVTQKTKDDADGAFTTSKEAEDIALNALVKLGLPTKQLVLQGIEQENLQNRNRYKITWSYYKYNLQPKFESIIKTEVDGGRINGINRGFIFKPGEENSKTLVPLILTVTLFVLILIITAMRMKNLTRMEMRVLISTGILLLICWVINVTLRMPQFISEMPQNISAITYKITTYIQYIAGGIIAIAMVLFALYAILAGRRTAFNTSNKISFITLRDAFLLLPVNLSAVAMMVAPIIYYIKWRIEYIDPALLLAVRNSMPADIRILPDTPQLNIINAFITSEPLLAMVISAIMIATITWVILELPAVFAKKINMRVWILFIAVIIIIAALLPKTALSVDYHALLLVSIIVTLISAGYLLITHLSRRNILVIPMTIFVAVIIHQSIALMQF